MRSCAASLASCLVFLLASGALAADGQEGKWSSIMGGELGSKLGSKGSAGVAVDRTTGDLFVVANDGPGIWKSTDQGKTCARYDDGKVSGHTETGWCLDLDPEGKRMACWMVYGNSAMTLDGGKTWKAIKGHVDYGFVDWTAKEPQAMMTVGHGGNKPLMTTDGGKTWKDLADTSQYNGFGCFGSEVIICRLVDALFRSTDGGKEFAKVTKKMQPSGHTMKVFKDNAYWTSDKGVMISKDKGQTWAILGSPVSGVLGPYFGTDENSLAVVGPDGVFITTDAGKSWTKAAPLAPDLKPGEVGVNYAWDPINNVLYAGGLGTAVYKLTLKATAASAPAK